MTPRSLFGIAPRRLAFLLLTATCVLVPLGLMAYKLYVLDYPLSGLIPATSYTVNVNMEVTGHGDDISMRTFLPRSGPRQLISGEENSSGVFTLGLETDSLNRVATWEAENVEGTHQVRYAYDVQGSHVRYEIPPNLAIPERYPDELQPYLAPQDGIQVGDPLIVAETGRIVPSPSPTALDALTRIHRHLQDDFANRNFSGYTDALTALKLGEASCNGKSRLFVAMARGLNLPARLVGGFIMEPGSKRTSHQWVEVYLSGHWVPFDTINDHFAEIPANYLNLYTGDEVLFRHTANVNFQYFFKTKKRLVPQREAQEALAHSVLNATNLYNVFEQLGISQNLLKIVMMIPFGALVVVIFRNVVGLETFGTFLPALIAAASRETGLWWGLAGFLTIIMLAALVRRGLDWMHLLHSPKMSIMLTIVVIAMLGLTVAATHAGLFDLAHVTLFPIAILAITAERFSLIEQEQGLGKVSRITAATLVVIAAAYWVMDSLFLQSLVLAFPEVLLLLVAINLWLGKWIGMRVSEFYRFRHLIFAERAAASGGKG
ncbi:MAG: UUP1 family membrane protein [Nitrospirota bacterium]|nr:UUP1 family membrane protein [Nitrospirota bacterium]